MTNVIIRCDAALLPEIGTGHAVRMAQFSSELALSQRLLVKFVSRTFNEFSIISEILKDKSSFYSFDDQQLIPNTEAEAQTLASCNEDVIIFDRLETSKDLIHFLRYNGKKVVSFDDQGDGSTLTNLTINSLVDAYDSKFPNILESYKYLIKKNSGHAVQKRKNRIFISCGGFDHSKIIIKLIEKIDFEKFSDYHFDFIVGNKPQYDELNQLIKFKDIPNILFLERPKNFFKLLATSKAAIITGGLTLFDAICLKVPTLSLAQYQHQERNIRKLSQLGLTTPCNIDSHPQLLNEILAQILEIKNNDLYCQEEIDNKGIERVISLLKKHEIL